MARCVLPAARCGRSHGAGLTDQSVLQLPLFVHGDFGVRWQGPGEIPQSPLRGWQTYLGGVRGRVGLQRLRADGERGATSVPCPDRVVDEVAVVVAAVFRETSSRPRLINSKRRCSLYCAYLVAGPNGQTKGNLP